MATLFAIVNPKEGKVIENMLGLYKDLLTMYEKAKNLTPGEVNNLMVCNVKDDAKTDVLMGVNTFIEIMSNAFGEPDKEILSQIVTEQRNEDFIVAFLQEFLNPAKKPCGDDRRRCCRVLKTCKEIFEEKEMQLYADICTAGIAEYSSNSVYL